MKGSFTNIFKAYIKSGQPHKGVVNAPDRVVRLFGIDHLSRRANKGSELYQMISKETSRTDRVLTVGGDHSTAFYSIGGQLEKYKDKEELGIVWFDTHADINTRKTSTSGNFHGMPVSFLMGIDTFENMKFPKLDPKNIVYVGCRDIDNPEMKIINDLNIPVIKSHEIIQSKHIPTIMHNVLHKHLGHCSKIHCSFDVDVMDPIVFPCTGTPVKEGLDVFQTKSVLEAIMQDPRFVSMDLVEYNPELDSEYANICDQVLKTLFSEV